MNEEGGKGDEAAPVAARGSVLLQSASAAWPRKWLYMWIRIEGPGFLLFTGVGRRKNEEKLEGIRPDLLFSPSEV
jgi:hypothetical protein